MTATPASETDRTRAIAQRYFAAWTARRSDEVLELLAEDLCFTAGPDILVEGREAFIDGEDWPAGVTTALLAEAYDGTHAFQLYDATHGAVTMRVAEHFTLRDGRIATIDFVADMAIYPAFIAGQPPTA